MFGLQARLHCSTPARSGPTTTMAYRPRAEVVLPIADYSRDHQLILSLVRLQSGREPLPEPAIN